MGLLTHISAHVLDRTARLPFLIALREVAPQP
jgi:hypothetical protein